MNTIITEQTDRGEVSFDVFGKLVESRILFLSDIISDEIATDIVASLLYLDHENDREKISLYINSEGGDIRNVFMIYDVMQMISSPVETFCIGSALKEATLILSAGTKGMRFATKSSVISINQLEHEGSMYLDLIKAETFLEKSKGDNKRFIEAMSHCTGKTIKSLLKETERELFLTVEGAKDYGIIDHIIERKP